MTAKRNTDMQFMRLIKSAGTLKKGKISWLKAVEMLWEKLVPMFEDPYFNFLVSIKYRRKLVKSCLWLSSFTLFIVRSHE
jgi:hypothetical protein